MAMPSKLWVREKVVRLNRTNQTSGYIPAKGEVSSFKGLNDAFGTFKGRQRFSILGLEIWNSGFQCIKYSFLVLLGDINDNHQMCFVSTNCTL